MSPRRKRRRTGAGSKARRTRTGRSVSSASSPVRDGLALLRSPKPAVWVVGLLLVLVALAVDPRMGDAFRSPKLWLAELLALVSLVFLVGRLPDLDRLAPKSLVRQPAILVVVPLLAAAVLSAVGSDSPEAVTGALASLAVGAAALLAWSFGLPRSRLRALLSFLLIPATILAVLGILQYHGGFRPFDFAGSQEAQRQGVTSLAGNPGDLGALLALAALIAQAEVLRRRGRGRWAMVALVAVLVYGLLVTQTLTAVAGLGLASLVLWGISMPRRRRLLAIGASVALVLVVIAGIRPVRERVIRLGEQVARGDLNPVLTGRLDAWRVAARMARDHPVNGVGHGAFEASFADAKLGLVDEGVPFFAGQHRVMFANAHNELLEVAAEWGVPGLLALIWGIGFLVLQTRTSRSRGDRDGGAGDEEDGEDGSRPGDDALAWSGLVLLGVLSLTFFPFRVALVAYPALVFLAWILSPGPSAGSSPEDVPEQKTGKGLRGRTLVWWLLPLLLAALLFQGQRYWNYWRAARVLRVVEYMTGQMVQTGRGDPGRLWRHVRLLEGAARLDPANAAIPLAKGSQYRLLRRHDEAQEAYRRALDLEPRPESWLNLGAAQAAADDKEAARESFLKAAKLDPRMRSQVPEPYRSELPTRLELLNQTP